MKTAFVAWIKAHAATVGYVMSGTLLTLTLAGVFLHDRVPVLGTFARWSAGIYFGTFAALAIGMMTLAPGYMMFEEILGAIAESTDSRTESVLKSLWAAIAGLLLSALLLGVFAAMTYGPLLDVKLWFIGLCWAVLMVPWTAVGWIGSRILQRVAQSRANLLDVSQHNVT